MTSPVGYYATIAQPVAAQQFVDETTVLTICYVYSITVSYDADGNKTAMARVSSPTQTYLMSSGDWMVMGPNVEGVYADSAFQAIFAPAVGTEVVAYVSPANGGPASAQLLLLASASTTCDIDWGDGQSDLAVAVPTADVPITMIHPYDAETRYTITVTSPDAPTVVCYFVAAFPQAVRADADEVVPPSADGGTVDPQITTLEMMSEMFPVTTQQSAPDPNSYGVWTAEQLARLEAGLPPYDTSGVT